MQGLGSGVWGITESLEKSLGIEVKDSLAVDLQNDVLIQVRCVGASQRGRLRMGW